MKKITSILTVVALLMMLMPISMGASFKFTPSASQTRVEAGDTITIDLKLSEINVGEKGINTFKCTFLYDKDVFENVSITSKNNWSISYNSQEDNEQYGTLLAVLISTGVTEDQDIGTITLKVKDGAQGKVGEITFGAVSTNDGETEISETDKIITITVNGSADTDDENGQGTTGNTQTNNNTQTTDNTQTDGNSQGSGNNQTTENAQSNNNNQQNVGGNAENVDNTQFQGTLPQTGLDSTIILVAIILSIIAIVFFYIQFRKNKDIK